MKPPSPTIDFFGRPFTAGEHIICLETQLRTVPAIKRDLVVSDIIKEARAAGWDMRSIPYSNEVNPFGGKVLLVIHMVDGLISKTPKQTDT